MAAAKEAQLRIRDKVLVCESERVCAHSSRVKRVSIKSGGGSGIQNQIWATKAYDAEGRLQLFFVGWHADTNNNFLQTLMHIFSIDPKKYAPDISEIFQPSTFAPI